MNLNTPWPTMPALKPLATIAQLELAPVARVCDSCGTIYEEYGSSTEDELLCVDCAEQRLPVARVCDSCGTVYEEYGSSTADEPICVDCWRAQEERQILSAAEIEFERAMQWADSRHEERVGK